LSTKSLLYLESETQKTWKTHKRWGSVWNLTNIAVDERKGYALSEHCEWYRLGLEGMKEGEEIPKPEEM